ncbi:DUF6457 domain-containing protein [Myceligenerans pegani]|uniref:Molybdopterin-guanine dinucleotide biosynthesis protein n=1 Tax=Myceligenerans pegani TaxID=2776917 RepID=A0ABR9MZX7_9MICO|nr:DUF6457 domain-containing protein [Myceligenerans sp. TRM 65318]MBE1876958.1 molybdopterin-guanine dinucleotide biosynthesis protein [Myceligenerans sp. TRM 65318]MBE3019229.1 molybdopterin-guanine dinucleotide biosynthesis protein [Myceligenerans sp. TRM 65318]
MTDLQTWISALETELGLEPGTIDMNTVLDLARDAAHAVARPAAPLTAYAVGYATGLAAATGDTTDAARKALALANRWPDDG